MKLLYTLIILFIYSSTLLGSTLKFSIDGLEHHSMEFSSMLIEEDVKQGYSIAYEKYLGSSREAFRFSVGIDLQIPREVDNSGAKFGLSSIYIKTKTQSNTYLLFNLGIIIRQFKNSEYEEIYIPKDSSKIKSFKYAIGVGRNVKGGSIELTYVNNIYKVKTKTSDIEIFGIESLNNTFISISYLFNI
jgi:hypothetical protein